MKYLILLISIAAISCNKEKQNEYFLHGNKTKYWDIVGKEGRWCYSFSKMGKCDYYSYIGKTCERSSFGYEDMVFEDTWVLKGDSIRFRSRNRKILILNADTLLTEFMGSRLLLLKSKCPD